LTGERTIATTTHGRYLAIGPSVPGPAQLLVGFHGYAEDAETQLARLRAIPGSERWHLISILGLHRFYQRRSNQVVASWMTRQDREAAIADNVAYVQACIEAECAAAQYTGHAAIVFAGFSQGVAMAFRAAVHAPGQASVIAAGSDVPPELDAAALRKISSVLIARGAADELYRETVFEKDEQRLREAGVPVRAVTLHAGHEWSDDLSAAAGEFLAHHQVKSGI
jgi:predicted esterase